MRDLSLSKFTFVKFNRSVNENEVKAIAAEFQAEDGPNNEGDMFERAAIL